MHQLVTLVDTLHVLTVLFDDARLLQDLARTARLKLCSLDQASPVFGADEMHLSLILIFQDKKIILSGNEGLTLMQTLLQNLSRNTSVLSNCSSKQSISLKKVLGESSTCVPVVDVQRVAYIEEV